MVTHYTNDSANADYLREMRAMEAEGERVHTYNGEPLVRVGDVLCLPATARDMLLWLDSEAA